MNLPLKLPAIRADANQLEMALLNLIVNARDATPDGGPILISASPVELSGKTDRLPAGCYVRLVVEDRGAGMDAETLRRATEPFFTTKGVGKGTGLGLPMVHGMAQQIGGLFELVSRPGEGTSAVLWLPVDEKAPAETAPITVDDNLPKVRRLTILAVDDDALVLLNTAALLEDLGHEVIEADSAAEALDLFRERGDIDLIVTDQAMPNMTGTQLIAEVERIRPGTRAIIASGYGEGVEASGDVIRLSKPFNQVQLARAVADAVERADA
jgi:CheY-like chemotaxis protein